MYIWGCADHITRWYGNSVYAGKNYRLYTKFETSEIDTIWYTFILLFVTGFDELIVQ